MALPSENRLKSATLISLVCKKGASWKTPFFRCMFLPSKFHSFQAVVVTSKKNYDNRATERNTIRRKINGYLQQKLTLHKTLQKKFPENLYVIFPNPSAKSASTEDLKKVIDKMIASTQNWNFSKNVKTNKRKNKINTKKEC